MRGRLIPDRTIPVQEERRVIMLSPIKIHYSRTTIFPVIVVNDEDAAHVAEASFEGFFI
jgi:hypothetical protein